MALTDSLIKVWQFEADPLHINYWYTFYSDWEPDTSQETELANFAGVVATPGKVGSKSWQPGGLDGLFQEIGNGYGYTLLRDPPHSISMWIYAKNLTSDFVHVIGNDDNEEDARLWSMWISNGGIKFYVWSYPEGSESYGQFYKNLGADTWYHVVVTWDVTGVTMIHINGDSITFMTGIIVGLPEGEVPNDNPYVAMVANFNGDCDCYIDQLCFWNRVLNDTDVDQLYNSGNGIPFIANSTASSKAIIAAQKTANAKARTQADLDSEANAKARIQADLDSEASAKARTLVHTDSDALAKIYSCFLSDKIAEAKARTKADGDVACEARALIASDIPVGTMVGGASAQLVGKVLKLRKKRPIILERLRTRVVFRDFPDIPEDD